MKSKNKGGNAATLHSPDQGAETVKAEFKYIAMDKIIESPLNPRKGFDSGDLTELSESIRTSKGVIHPILLRPYKFPELEKGKLNTMADLTYQIVAGARRFRACKLLKMETIAATIREMSDQDALEVMIMENLERKDVHPMEEAAGIKQLLAMNGYTIEEITKRLGKSHRYIAQRIKLNDLTTDWQKAFYDDRLSMTDALKVCKLSPDSMKDIFRDCGDQREIRINDYTIRQYMNDLTKAPFDITDKDLNKKMGACTGCQFNTAGNNLFPDEAAQAICTNSGCFQLKSNNAFLKRLDEAKATKDVIFVTSDYSLSGESEKALKQLTGAERILSGRDYNELYQPDMEEIIEDETDCYLSDHDIDNEEDLKEKDRVALKKEIDTRYQRELAEYNKKMESGKLQKVLYVDGNEKGQIGYVAINKSASKKAVDAGAVAADAPSLVIKNIHEREKRYKELDAAKVYKAVYASVEKGKYSDKDETLLPSEWSALAMFVVSKLGYGFRDKVKKAFGWESGYRDNKLWLKLQKFDQKKFNRLIRFLLLQEALSPESSDACHMNSDIDAAFYQAAKHFLPKEVKAAEDAQAEVSTKRQSNQAKKIAKLREENKKPEPKAKPKAKKG